jgi:hypothetical protein
MIIRLYAMYQRSRKILFYLSGIYSAVLIACAVIGAIQSTGVSGGELQLFD